MWPPCKERQNQVNLGHASHRCLHRLWSHHIPLRHRLLGAAVDMGPWEGYGSDREPMFGYKALEMLGERKRGRRAGSRADPGRDLLEKKMFPWSLSEAQERKRKRETNTWRPHQSLLAKQNHPHRPKETLQQTCKDTLQGAQGKERSQGHPGKDSLSLFARMCPQWDTSLLPPHGSTTARLQG